MTETQVVWRYTICGLRVDSELELSGAAQHHDGAAEAEVVIKRGAPGRPWAEPTRRGPNWEICPDGVTLEVPGVVRLWMKAGREIHVEPAAGRSDEEVAIFITGTALGVLLQQRGAYVLHAGAVEVDGRAMLFCAASGEGKSSLVAALAAAGYGLLSDDLGCVVGGEGVARVVPDGRRLKLWADTIARLGLAGRQGSAVRPGIEKYWVDPPQPPGGHALELGGLYFLRQADPPYTSGLERATLLETVERLRSNAYRPKLVREFGHEQVWLERSMQLASRTPAWHLTRHWRLDGVAETVAQLGAHWRSL